MGGRLHVDLVLAMRWLSLTILGLLVVLLTGPWLAATSHFVTAQDAGVGAAEYLSLDAGGSGLLVTEAGISLATTDDGVGLAPNGKYWYGSHDAPTETFGFTFTHHAATEPALTVRFDRAGGVEHGAIAFSVYDARGTFIGAVSDGERALTFPGGPAGSAFYVVVVVDTGGLSPGEDVRGVFSVTLG